MAGSEILGTSNDPAVNTEHSFTFLVGFDYRLKSLHTILVTDGNAADRDVTFVFTLGGVVFFKLSHNTVIPASQTIELTGAEGMPFQTAGNGDESMALPKDFVIPGGTIVTTETVNIQATDNFDILTFFGQRLNQI